jgi:DNA-binding GntR family transcriptional regulator
MLTICERGEPMDSDYPWSDARVVQPEPGLGGPGQHSVKLARSFYSGRVAAFLRERIIGGELPAGTPLVEHRLAETLSVSRGPIRSALQALEGEGLVRTRPNGRAESAGFGARDLQDLFAVRYEMETRAISWGIDAKRDLAPVTEAFGAIERAGASTLRLVDLDIAFHKTLVEFSGSRFLVQAWLAVAPVIQAVITLGNRELAAQDPKSNFARIVDSHRALVDAISQYDSRATTQMLGKQFDLTQSMFHAAHDAPEGDAPADD